MPEKTIKKICKCENCGNEAEMVITCALEAEEASPPRPVPSAPAVDKHQTKGHGVCTHCGNEADMWVDLES
jgi:transcription elongation factor Elf1